jgi:hypothetical protein
LAATPTHEPPFAGPLNFTGTAREAWHFYRLRPLEIIALFTLTYLAAGVALFTFSRPGAAQLGQVAVGVTLGLVLPIGGSLVTAVALLLIHDASVGRARSLREAVAKLAGSWKEVVGAALLACVVTLVVTTVLRVLLVTPLALLSFLLLASVPPLLFGPPIVMHAVVLEGRSLAEAWQRARTLMSGNWRRVIAYWVLLALATGILVILVGGVMVALVGDHELVLGALNALTSGLLIPYVVAFVLAGFYDLRARRDGPASAPASP